MPEDFGKVVVGVGMAIAGAATGNVPLFISGAASFYSGLYGMFDGDGGVVNANLTGRQQGMLLNNRAAVGTAIPVVYGTIRLGVVPNDYRVDTASTDNKDLYIPAVVCHGSRDGLGIAGFKEVYFDEVEAFDSTGAVKARYNGKAFKTDILGEAAETWSATEVDGEDLVGVTDDWSTDDDGDGLAGILFKLIYDKDVYSGIPTITVKTVGNLVEDTRDEITGTISFNTTTEVINHADVSDGDWAAGDRVEVTSGACAGNYTVASVSGDDITVVENLPSTTSYSTTIKRWAHPDNGGTNPALCIRDYLLSSIYGMGNVVASTDIDDTSFEAAANAYDTVDAPDGAGGTQKRFECNGWVDTSKAVKSNLAELLSSCRGNLVYQAGKWRLFTTWTKTAETFELSEANIMGGTWSFANAGQDSKFNISRATFPNLDDNWTPDEVQWPKTGAANAYLTADNSIENRLELDLPFTTDIVMAEQIAMIRLKESREGITASVTCRESALQLQIGDVVKVTHETPAWTEKEFWVAAVMPRPDFLVDLTLREYDASAYSYDAQTTSSLAADTDLPNPFAINAPSGLTLTAQYRFVGGQGLAQIRAAWTAPSHAQLTDYELLAKRVSVPAYDSSCVNSNTNSRFEPSSGLTLYDFAVNDLVEVNDAGGSKANDGTYRITSIDWDNGYIYVTPAPATDVTLATHFRQVNPYQSFGTVPVEAEGFVISPIDVAMTSERWRVHLRAKNTLGIRSHGSQNLALVSDDLSHARWAGSATVTTGQTDPDGGSNACLLEDDSGAGAEDKYIGSFYNDVLEFEVTGPKRIGCYIKQGTAAVSALKLLGNGYAPQSWVIFELTWSTMAWALTHAASAGDCKYTGTVVKCESAGSGWYWVELRIAGVEPNDWLSFHYIPAGTTVANTGTMYAYRLVVIDDDREITVMPQTAGTRAGDVTLSNDVVNIDDGDSPYDVTDADLDIIANAASGAVTVNLPFAKNNPGRRLRIKAIDVTNAVSLAAQTGDTCDYSAIATANQVYTFVADAANNKWRFMAATIGVWG